MRRVLEIVATYADDPAAIATEFPELETEDIRQALGFAAANLDDVLIELRPAS